MQKRRIVIDTVKTVTYLLTLSSIVFSIGIWITKPRAEVFIKEICKLEYVPLCKKLDSLITVSEKHRMETRDDLDRVIFVLLESIPEQKRQKAIKKYEAFYGRKKETTK